MQVLFLLLQVSGLLQITNKELTVPAQIVKSPLLRFILFVGSETIVKQIRNNYQNKLYFKFNILKLIIL